MGKNLIPDICKMLGVEVGEKFKIKGHTSETIYSIEDDGHIEVAPCFLSNINLRRLLSGDFEIVKLSWEPKEKEKFWSFYFLPNGFLMAAVRRWNSESIEHLALLKAGWVYRTQEEAEAALPKVAEELRVKYEL